MLIDGIGISAYRSFGSEVQRIGPFGKINLFIGQNNSGKSNILRFLAQHYGPALQCTRGQPGALTFDDVDRHLGEELGRMRLEFALTLDGANHRALVDQCSTSLKAH